MSGTGADEYDGGQKERRSFFGSVRPKADNHEGPRYPTTHPLTQANFVVGFTSSTISLYTVTLYVCSQNNFIPPLRFYVALITVYFVLWGSLYIERFPALTAAFINNVRRRPHTKIDVTKERVVDSATPSGLDANDWRAPSIEEHTDPFRYDKGVVWRVYALVVASVFFSCLFAMYSGGPFQSAYSQIIVAYPLFATGFARRWWSLVSIYAVTALFAGAFQVSKSFFGFFSYSTQTTGWYVVVTIILLCSSLFVALINLDTERARVRQQYDESRKCS